MDEALHTPDKLPIASGMGWMQMELLLNKSLPVKKQFSFIRMLGSYLPAVLVSILFLFSSLQLNNILPSDTIFSNTIFINKGQRIFSSLNYNEKKYSANTNSLIEKKYSVFPINSTLDLLPLRHQFVADENMPGVKRIGIQHFIKYIPEKRSGNYILINRLPGFRNQLSVPENKSASKYPNKKSWEFSAGLGMNIATGKHQNLQPYPVAEVKYNLSSRFFIAGGLSLLSPKPGTISGISKTVHINDTVNNISLYNEVIAYDRLRYIDVPLSAGVNINKKWMFQSGLQLSVLASKQRKEFSKQYDFQMNSIDLTYRAPLSVAVSPQEEFKVRLPNMDYRFTAGLKYKFNRTTAGLFYQHGLSSGGKGNGIIKTGNQFFTFNVLYQLK